MSIYSRICPLCEKGMDEDICPEHHVPTIEIAMLEDQGDSLTPGDEIAGRYRVMHLLGKGAMGSVYLANQLSMDREVAIKTLLKSLLSDYKLVQRFYREARAASKLDHPNIIRTYDFGIDPATKAPYIVMEYVEGEELADMLKASRSFSEEKACTIMTQISKALVEAHSKGVVHRDLKPQNIRVRTLADGDIQVKVLDFGIAKVLQGDKDDEKLTGTGMTVGTPPYMSPEQILGGSVDARADLYSMGCILHELLTGSTPFDSADRLQNFMLHVNAKPPEIPQELVDGKAPSEGLRILHQSLLSKDRDRRPRDASLVAKVFKSLAMGQTAEVSTALSEALAEIRLSHVTSPDDKALSGAELAQISQEATDVAIPTDPKQLILPAGAVIPGTGGARVEPVATGPAIPVESIQAAPPTAAPPAETGVAQPSPAGASNRWWIPAGIASAAAIVAVVVVSSGGGDPAEPKPAPPAPAPAPATAAASSGATGKAQPAAGSAATEQVKLKRVTLVTVPPGATVLEGQTELGVTPLDVVFRPGIGERALSLRRSGHVSREVVLSRETASPHTVTLRLVVAAPPAKPVAAPTPAGSAKAAVTPKKTRASTKRKRRVVKRTKPKKTKKASAKPKKKKKKKPKMEAW